MRLPIRCSLKSHGCLSPETDGDAFLGGLPTFEIGRVSDPGYEKMGEDMLKGYKIGHWVWVASLEPDCLLH